MQPRSQSLLEQLFTKQLVLRACQVTHRTYATVTTATPSDAVKSPLRRRKGGDLGSHLPRHVIPTDILIPPYPYGEHALFKQANRGLYGNQMIQFGNNVSERTETKTRRYWKPNVLSKSLYSIALKKKIKLRITGRVLKTMDREGGLDEYLLKDSEYRLKELGPLGWALRWTLLQRPGVVARMRAEAAALGLDQATIDQQWPTPEMRAVQHASRDDFVKASDLVGEEEGEGEGEEEFEHAAERLDKVVDRTAETKAIKEYKAAVRAAMRYMTNGLVDSLEDGLKVAFLRQPERTRDAARCKATWQAKLAELFPADECKRMRSHHKLGSATSDEETREFAIHHYLDKKAPGFNTIREFQNSIQLASFGGIYDKDALHAKHKAEFAELLAEAERAHVDSSVGVERRDFIETALQKAKWAFTARTERKGNGQNFYVRVVLGDSTQSKIVSDPSSTANTDNGAGWEDISASKQTIAEQQPRA